MEQFHMALLVFEIPTPKLNVRKSMMFFSFKIINVKIGFQL